MRIIFMGTPDFAVPSLKSLIESHEVAAVVCQPDKPSGRGNKVVFGPVKTLAVEKGIDVLQPKTVKEEGFEKKLASYNPDMIVVVAYGQILPKTILTLPPMGCINVHGSLLPKYRGAAPIQWAIINGEELTGITVIHMSEKMDAGDMVLKKQLVIEPEDNYKTLHNKMSVLGARALIQSIADIENKQDIIIMQNEAEVTYAPMITRETGRIDWSKDAKSIANLIRGLDPYPGAYTYLNAEMLKIWKAEEFHQSERSVDENDVEADFGEIVSVLSNKGIVVQTGKGLLMLTEIQAPNGKRMLCQDYLRGHSIETGLKLTSSAEPKS